MKIKGFTLVEMIVAVSVTVILGLVLTDALMENLRGQNKTRVISQAKQDGQNILDSLSNAIRFSQAVICVNSLTSPNQDTIVILNNGSYIRYRFTPAVDSTINGKITAEILTSGTPTPTPISGVLPASDWLCQIASGTNVQSLSNTDLINGVSLARDIDPLGASIAVFSWDNSPGHSPNVTIRFRALAGVGSGQAYEDSLSSGGILYTTTVALRGGT